jgi:hypothetical protein
MTRHTLAPVSRRGAFTLHQSLALRGTIHQFNPESNTKKFTHLDKSLGSLEEMLFSLWFGSFCMPVNDCLVRYTIGIVQDLQQLCKRLHESCIGVAVDLGRVD